MDKIIIKGAREHNLKNINLELPKNKLIVFTGVSGSGKSSLAFDTLYSEGQRRYVESLSSYARQFLQVSHRPDVDLIEGLSPAIAIDQKSISNNPRSTVGTVTEIYDYLRLLFSRIGHPHCPNCSREISPQSIQQIIDNIEEEIINEVKTNGIAKIYILSPIIKTRKGSFDQLFANLIKQGYETARIDGYFMDLKDDPHLLKNNKHTIETITDKLIITRKDLKKFNFFRSRIFESARQALELSDGSLILSIVEDESFSFSFGPKKMTDKLYSQKFACPTCNISVQNFEPSSFSFNSPVGACLECHGLGIKMSIDRSQFPEWKASQLESRYYTTTSEYIRNEIEKLMIKKACDLCNGARLKPEILSVTVLNKNIYDITKLSIDKLELWVSTLETNLISDKEKQISEPIIKEIQTRIKFLLAVGLDYLDLARIAGSLSTGEGQRIRLASQIGTGLTGVLYILDEPTVGLHPRDNLRLIKTLEKLRDIGNTPIVIEHDEEVMKHSDWMVDFGPLAGKNGGKIVAEGILDQIKKNPNSLTGQYLSGKKTIPIMSSLRGFPSMLFRSDSGDEVPLSGTTLTSFARNDNEQWLKIIGCQEHNLKNIDLKIPLNKLVCITGVSGSGKSTVLEDTLYRVVKKKLNPESNEKPGLHESVIGGDSLARVLIVDQSPIGRTSRSNPATYTSVWTEVRELFAGSKTSKIKGFNKSFFSFNTKGGRCEACQGQGETKIEMQFLSDIWVECEVCHGQRFIDEVLEVYWNDKNIYEVLQLTVEEALGFFRSIPQIVHKLQKLKAIGLDYLKLGQSSPTLSGGESQRLKLARELVKPTSGNTLYILDEPTVGLHYYDLEKLLHILKELIARGNSVVVIEHNMDVIKNADWIIDLGPEGGEKGGYIVVQGQPKDIIKSEKSYTGKFLKLKIKNEN